MAKKKSDDLQSVFEDLQIEEKIDDTFSFISDFKGNLEDPYHLLKVYNYKNEENNSDIDIVYERHKCWSLPSD